MNFKWVALSCLCLWNMQVYAGNGTGLMTEAHKVEEKETHCRLMSYNIHNAIGMDGKTDCSRIAEVIASVHPDVVAVQEVDSVTGRSKGKYILQEVAQRVGMYAVFAPAIDYDGGKYGIGILAKEKPLRVKQVALPGREEARTLLIAEFGKYVFLATHFSLTPEDQELSVKVIEAELKEWGKPVFLAGDMNSRPASLVQQMLRKKFRVLTADDWDTCGRSCIDFIYAYKEDGVPVEVKNRQMIEDRLASDHCPVYVDVTF